MYRNISTDLIADVLGRANEWSLKERANFKQYAEIIEEYAQSHNLIAGEQTGIDLVLHRPFHRDCYPYVFYSVNPEEDGNNIADELYKQTTYPYILANSQLDGAEVLVKVADRVMIKLIRLDEYKGVNLINLTDPIIHEGWFNHHIRCINSNVQLARIYRQMSSPAYVDKWESLIPDEQEMFFLEKGAIKNEEKVSGSADEKCKVSDTLDCSCEFEYKTKIEPFEKAFTEKNIEKLKNNEICHSCEYFEIDEMIKNNNNNNNNNNKNNKDNNDKKNKKDNKDKKDKKDKPSGGMEKIASYIIDGDGADEPEQNITLEKEEISEPVPEKEEIIEPAPEKGNIEPAPEKTFVKGNIESNPSKNQNIIKIKNDIITPSGAVIIGEKFNKLQITNIDNVELETKLNNIFAGKIKKIIQYPKIPGDERLRRYTYYLLDGERKQPIVDLFNIAEYDPVPQKNGYVHPIVSMRMLIVDIWTLNLIKEIGQVDENFAMRRIADMHAEFLNLRNNISESGLITLADTLDIYSAGYTYVGTMDKDQYAKSKIIRKMRNTSDIYMPYKETLGRGLDNEDDFTNNYVSDADNADDIGARTYYPYRIAGNSEKQSEPQAESKTESQSEPQTESQEESKTESQTESQTEKQTESQKNISNYKGGWAYNRDDNIRDDNIRIYSKVSSK